MQVRLSKWQTKVLEDPARFKVINVGRRSGKTVLSVLRMLIEVSKRKCVVWYISPTYKQSKNIAWSLLKEYCPETFKPNWNETELKCSLPNGAEIHLKGADNPDSLRGTKVDLFVFDEVAFFTEWKRTWEALRPILVDSQAPAWFVSTPNGFNHFYDLYNKANLDPDYKAFHFTSYDNPYVSAEEIDKAKLEMEERSFSQEFLAEFNKPSGTVYAEWNLDNYKPFEYDPNLPLHLSWDFGVSDPTSLIWIQPHGSEVRIIDYYEASDPALEHFIQVINSKPYKTIELHTGDPAGKSRILGMNSTDGPITNLAKRGIFVRTKDGVRIKDQIRTSHSFMPRLFVNSDKCERFRDCLLNYRYPIKPETAINQENEIPIHDEYSHAMRAFEYWCVNWGDTKPKEKAVVAGYTKGMPGTGYGRRPIFKADMI